MPSDAPGIWPQGADIEPSLSISKVQQLLVKEFPSVSKAKLRLLEKHGIVAPARMSNGYRGYSEADVERIRYALRQQRDSYLPLDRIGKNLTLLDRGEQPLQAEPVARVVARDGEVALPETGKRLTVRQILDYTGVGAQALEKYVEAKFITPDLSGRFSSRVVPVVNALVVLEKAGIEPRNLRSARSAANATLDLVDKVVSPTRQRNNAAAKERARLEANNLAEQLSSLVDSLIQLGVEELG